MSKKMKIIAIVIVALVVVVGGGGYYLSQNAGVAVDVAKVSKAPLAVTVLASGKVGAGVSQDVYPGSQGVVKKLHVENGDIVEKGDTILTLDTEPLEAQLKQAQSALSQAKSGLAQANAASTTKDAGVSAAQAGLDAARVGYSSATTVKSIAWSTYKSAKALLDAADPLSPSYSTLKSATNQAQIAYEQAKSGVAQASAGVAQAKAGLAQAKAANVSGAKSAASAGVAAAEKAVAMAKQAIEDATIVAPASGEVVLAQTAVAAQAAASGGSALVGAKLGAGSAVMPGSPIATIVDPEKMSFLAEVDEVDVAKIKIGQKAKVALDSYSNKTFDAVVTKIGSTAKTTLTGGTIFPVELEITSSKDRPKIGMKGDVTVEISVEQSVLTIPISALFSEGGTDFVYTITEGKLKKAEIAAGTTTDTEVEILSGLDEGTEVVLAGKTPLIEGMPAKVNAAKK